jgi:putative PIN family toxin of toxin-antitoxin system
VRVILDTNVFVSGVFFSGAPHDILGLWRDGKLRLVVSAEILDEYRRVGRRLAGSHPGIDLEPFLSLLAVHAEIVQAPSLPEPVCEDPTDDMFLACALAARVRFIVSGDKHLLRVSGHRGVSVVRPRAFIDSRSRRA